MSYLKEKNCAQCNDIFYKKTNESVKAWSKKRCCSLGCAGVFKRKSEVSHKYCEICSESFSVIGKAIHERDKIKYCSRTCFYKSRKGIHHSDTWNKNIADGNRKGERLEAECKECKTYFSILKCIYNRTDRNQGQFCSKQCKDTFHGKKVSGANHPLWKGGVTPLHNKIRNCKKYEEWRKFIIERDNFTCIECGIRGGVLNVDHIKPFSFILKEYQPNTLEEALSCIEFWDFNNGRTLCKRCHNNIGWRPYKTNYPNTRIPNML